MTYPLVAYLEVCSFVLPVGAGLWKPRFLGDDRRFFFLYALWCAASEVVTGLMAFSGVRNQLIGHLEVIVELGLLLLALSAWNRQPIFSRVALWAGGCYALFWIVGKFSFEPFSGEVGPDVAAAMMIAVPFAIWTLIAVMQEPAGSIFRDIRFWGAAGVLLMYGVGFVSYGLLHWISALPKAEVLTIWTAQLWVAVVSNVICALGFLCPPRT